MFDEQLNNTIFGYHSLVGTPGFNLFNNTISTKLTEVTSTISTLPIWLTILIYIAAVLIITELIFFRSMKKKIPFNICGDKKQVDEVIFNRKLLAWIGGLLLPPLLSYLIAIVLMFLLLLVLLIYITVINILYVLINILFWGLLCLLAWGGFKVIYAINKKFADKRIVLQTKEEFEEEQKKYKFRDGSQVQLKKDLIVGIRYGGKKYNADKSKLQDKILTVRSHHEDEPNVFHINVDGKRYDGEGGYHFTDEMVEVVIEESKGDNNVNIK